MVPSDFENTAPAEVETFLRLFAVHRQRIFQYILGLIPNLHDAEDVLQETNVVLWRKFGDFKPGTSFVAWATRIAHFEVLRHRRRQARSRKQIILDEEVLQLLAYDASGNCDHLAAASEVLHRCVEKLSDADRELLRLTYSTAQKITDIAAQIGRPANSVYKSLGRIRQALMDCVKRGLRLAEQPGGDIA